MNKTRLNLISLNRLAMRHPISPRNRMFDVALLIITGFITLLLVGIAYQLRPTPASSTADAQTMSQLPLYFIKNQGQLDEQVAYYVLGQDTAVYFTATGVTIAQTTSTAQRWSVKLDFVGANPHVQPIGEAPTEAIISYFKGQPDEWHSGLPTYGRVVYPDLWPGIDLVYEGSASRLKYSFIVQPGADPAQIQLAYRGATEVLLNAAGQMEVKTPLGGFTDDAPIAYQEIGGTRIPVDMAYKPGAASAAPHSQVGKATAVADAYPFTFHVGAYDPNWPLVLDPEVLLYAGYIGGAAGEVGHAIAVDGSGNAYITGYTASTEATFPVLAGPDLSFNGEHDAFVVKVSATGQSLVYAGYIGGALYEAGNGIAVDGAGNAYVTGFTNSTEATFPVVIGPDVTANGDGDAFVAKVNSSGTALLYAGYIGGAVADFGQSIAVDATGNAYVTGYTESTELTFPVLVGPDLTHNGNFDAFVAKVSDSGASLLYAGYIGGWEADYGYGIAVDGAGSAYVVGHTDSTETTFPILMGPDLTHNGANDAFIAKINSDGAALAYAGYIGGGQSDVSAAVAVDAAGYAYVVGRTVSDETTFPVLVGPDLTHNGGTDAFVAKVHHSGDSLVYAGYIGGEGTDLGSDIALDVAGNAYVAGYTSSTESSFPVVGGPDLTFNGGNTDAFVGKVSQTGVSLLYAGYIGGAGVELALGIAVDDAGHAYVTGSTSSTEATFPVIVGPDLSFNGGIDDAFVVKVINGADALPPESSVAAPPYANSAPITVTWSASDGGSGVAATTLWVRFATSHAWMDIGTQPGTSGTFFYTPTQGDGAYYFATVAVDVNGNEEPFPTGSGGSATIYDTVAPTSIATVPITATNGPIAIQWTADDVTSGVSQTALWVKPGSEGVWMAAGLWQSGYSGVFYYTSTGGSNTYYFATVATDNAGNVEAPPTGDDEGEGGTIYESTHTLYLPVILSSVPVHFQAQWPPVPLHMTANKSHD